MAELRAPLQIVFRDEKREPSPRMGSALPSLHPVRRKPKLHAREAILRRAIREGSGRMGSRAAPAVIPSPIGSRRSCSKVVGTAGSSSGALRPIDQKDARGTMM
jgi:hypothetical protein